MKLGGRELRPHHALIGTVVSLLLWQGLVWFCDWFGWYRLAEGLSLWGTLAFFFVGLFWAVWVVEKYTQRVERSDAEVGERKLVWNPINPHAWYYGRQSQRYKQSLSVLSLYSLFFFVLMILFSRLTGCDEREYELPAGGGQEMIQRKVTIKKVVKKKFVINPYSSILFNPPKIDHIDPQLTKESQHLYKVGQGKGDGAGFSGGTSKGMIRFIRLQYNGGDWDQDYGVGGDLNLLNQYGIRTGQKIAKKTEHFTPSQLGTFKALKNPPLIYLTGQKGIYLSANDKKILKRYLLERHGMIFGDNGGSRHFHNQFISLMRELTGVQEVPIPLDDIIHQRPYAVPFLPYVSPHGGKMALGWKREGRWVAYYHPGDIGDAWSDGHAGVSPRVYEACYQLGVNVIYYAHAEYNKWLQSQKKP